MTWKPADQQPEESGDYLCIMMDGREAYNDERWTEVVHFKKCYKATKGRWETCNFDKVLSWQEIEEFPEL